jgi:hypothetical protein
MICIILTCPLEVWLLLLLEAVNLFFLKKKEGTQPTGVAVDNLFKEYILEVLND